MLKYDFKVEGTTNMKKAFIQGLFNFYHTAKCCNKNSRLLEKILWREKGIDDQ